MPLSKSKNFESCFLINEILESTLSELSKFLSFDFPEGSEVITPALTFSTTVGCIVKNNLIQNKNKCEHVLEGVMKFQFDWKEKISGSVEIEAESGRHAEEIFNSKTRTNLLEKSDELRSQGVSVDFIDSRMNGLVTHKEWKSDWRMSDEEWGFWSNVTPD